MTMQELIDDYLKHCTNNEEFAERSISRYTYLLDVYREYVEDKCNISGAALEPFFNGIDVVNILNAAEYYLDNRRVNSQDTIDMFVSVAKEFHRYIRNQYNITSEKVFVSMGLSDNDENSFTFQYTEFCVRLKKEKRIKYTSQGRVYLKAEIEDLIEYCNDNLISDFDPKKKQENCFNRFVKALMVKLVIYTGASVADKIYPIKVNGLNLNKGTVLVGEYEVHLPYHLRNNMNDYVSNLIKGRDGNDLLFKTYYNIPFKEPNQIGGFNTYNNKISSTIALSKYAIIQMIEAGIDRDTIQEFTGYGDAVYVACKEYVDMGIYDRRAKVIDSTLKTLSLFDIL